MKLTDGQRKLATLAVAGCGLVLAAALAAVGVSAMAQQSAAPAAPQSGAELFQSRCASCHEPAVGRAPDRAYLKQLGLLEVFNELKNGSMRPMAQGLSDDQLGAVAAYLSPPSRAPAAPPLADPPKCPPRPPMALGASDWPSWGRSPSNWRDQRTPGFAADAAARLKVKWSFAIGGGKTGQPTVAGGRVLLVSLGGAAYALDARTGCLDWRFDGAASRSTITVGPLAASPSGYAAFFGAMGGAVYALDAADGKLIWRQKIEDHPLGILTGGSVLAGGRLYVPLSSYEELTATRADYGCCTFQGGVVAMDAASGKILWKTRAISQPPAPSHKNAAGTQMYGPAGAAIWSSPTIDAKRGLLYVDTGDSYTDVKEDGSDSIIAIDLASGAVKWRRQVTADDNYLSGCERPQVNCPKPVGHDFDFGASPVLVPLASGGDVLLAGQKSGTVYGLDPGSGKVLWQTQVGHGGALGGIEFGMASDGQRLYVANADAFMPAPPGRPGLAALDPASGRQIWFTPSPHLPCGWTAGAPCMNGVSAAPTVVPGLVFAGDMNGRLRAYAAGSGRIVWEVDTGAGRYQTVNGGPAQPGGNIDGPGPVVTGGMLYVMSGYVGSLGGAPTSVLLAYSVDGR